MVVAIDGPAGVGKSTLAGRIARESGFFYLNSGNLYRAVTRRLLKEGRELSSEETAGRVAEDCRFEVREGRLICCGEDVEDCLHTDEIDRRVAQVSAFPRVRHGVNAEIRRLAASMDLVAEGRDMATVVFPDAELKLFLDASPEVRAQRRLDQGVSRMSYPEILESIQKRDSIDRAKKFGGLKIADDAVVLDTSALTIEQVCEKVTTLIDERKRTQE